MKSAEIRSAFLSYFESKQHQIVESSSLIPGDDPTLLFTNAGMVQFKDVFLGTDKRQYHRATSSQRCVRAGGKHNDLENVGYTARHHTFFEMLGNFSFGDYFKKDAIYFAWEFLTQILGLPEEKLWITVHINDDEAADIWLNDVGVSADRFSRLDEDNFWQMGDTGPCGPSSEIFYDHGSDVPGGPPGSEGDDLDRYIEIWNLVFMQYERQPDATLEALPKPSVDTGMGLERIAAVMQGVHTNYDIDLFQALLAAAAKATETTNLAAKSLRVIADHIRSCSFLVSDGVLPSNEGRGYVLRRIIRRAIRHGNQLGQKHVFFSTLVSSLVGQMGDAYPELKENQTHIENVLLAEEVQFAKTLDKGMLVLDDKLANLKGTVIPGDIIFALYDTYGFPVDLTNDIARERHLSLDMEAYDVLMEAQRKKSKEAGVFKADYTNKLDLDSKTEFVGYESLIAQGKVLAILVDGKKIQSLDVDIAATVVLDKTPFYGESGGQVGDAGYLYGGKSRSTQFDVINTLKYGDVHLHEGKLLSGTLSIGDDVDAAVDSGVRAATARNHSATHLMHAALRAVLGDHVTQKGSLVDSKRLRFDFSHTQAVSDAELNEISRMVNKHIRANVAVSTDLCDIKAAKAKGALALFGEKYGSEVRVLSMGEHDFSVELCGGTHVRRTGDIQFFDMVSESGIASGIRRIEAVTGEQAFALVEEMRAQNQALADQLKTDKDNIPVKVLQMLKHNKELEKSVAELKSKLASVSMNEWLAEAQSVNGVTLLVKQLENVDAKELRVMSDRLKDKLGDSSAVLLASITGGKIALVAGVSKKAISKVKAGDIVRHVASLVGGKGGGRPDMAQGGGTDVDALPSALTQVRALLD